MPTPPHDRREPFVKRIGKPHVPDDASLEESPRPHALGAIDDLIRDDEIARSDLLLQAADGGEGDDGADAERAEGGDVGARGDFVRGELVVEAVAGEEGDGGWVPGRGGGVVQDRDRGGGSAPRGCGVEGRDRGEVCEFFQACAAYYGDSDGVWGGLRCMSVEVRYGLNVRTLMIGEDFGGGLYPWETIKVLPTFIFVWKVCHPTM